MVKKVQLPVIGGVRKTIQIPDQQSAGTTIAGLAGQTITIAQLASLLGVQQQKPNTQGGGSGTQAALILGPGLGGGGLLVGAVPLNITAPIPWMMGDDGGGGGDGDPGPPGLAGAQGATGSAGPTGPAVFLAGDDGEDGFPAIPGTPGANGNTGAAGAQGPPGSAIFLASDDGLDGMDAVPGPPGVAGAAGSQGPAGPAIYLLNDDGADGDNGPPGLPGAAGASGIIVPSSDLLLHFDGTNGQTTTVDSGKHGFAVTRVSTATLENTQVKFGTTATQITNTVGWSIAHDPALQFRLNNFIIDFWIYPTTLVSGSNQENAIMNKWSGSGANLEWYITLNSSVGLAFYYNGSFPNFGIPFSVFTGALNTWMHIEIVRIGQWIQAFINGVLTGTPIAIGTGDIGSGGTSSVLVGASGVATQAMYIDEVRIVNFLQNFPVPTAPYTS